MSKRGKKLSRRAAETMDLLYQRGELTANELYELLSDLPSQAAARSVLRNLEKKGHVVHETRDMQYVYMAKVAKREAQQSALRQMLTTFFNGSPISMMRALVRLEDADLTDAERRRLTAMIDVAEKDQSS